MRNYVCRCRGGFFSWSTAIPAFCGTGGRPPSSQSHVSCGYGTQGGRRPGTLLCTTQALSSLARSGVCTSTEHPHSLQWGPGPSEECGASNPQLRGPGERGRDTGGELHPAKLCLKCYPRPSSHLAAAPGAALSPTRPWWPAACGQRPGSGLAPQEHLNPLNGRSHGTPTPLW